MALSSGKKTRQQTYAAIVLTALVVAGTAIFAPRLIYADSLYHNLAASNFSQNWSNSGLVTADDNWNNVPSIVGYRGDELTGATGANPGDLTGASSVIDVNANRPDPNTFTTGGVAEFHIGDPVVALQGSGTADAPYPASFECNGPSEYPRFVPPSRPRVRRRQCRSTSCAAVPSQAG